MSVASSWMSSINTSIQNVINTITNDNYLEYAVSSGFGDVPIAAYGMVIIVLSTLVYATAADSKNITDLSTIANNVVQSIPGFSDKEKSVQTEEEEKKQVDKEEEDYEAVKKAEEQEKEKEKEKTEEKPEEKEEEKSDDKDKTEEKEKEKSKEEEEEEEEEEVKGGRKNKTRNASKRTKKKGTKKNKRILKSLKLIPKI